MTDRAYIAKTVLNLIKLFPESYELGGEREVKEYFIGRVHLSDLNDVTVHHGEVLAFHPDPAANLDEFIKFIIESPNDTVVSWSDEIEIVKLGDRWYILETKDYKGTGKTNIIVAAQMEDLEVGDVTPYLEVFFNDEDRNMWGSE